MALHLPLIHARRPICLHEDLCLCAWKLLGPLHPADPDSWRISAVQQPLPSNGWQQPARSIRLGRPLRNIPSGCMALRCMLSAGSLGGGPRGMSSTVPSGSWLMSLLYRLPPFSVSLFHSPAVLPCASLLNKLLTLESLLQALLLGNPNESRVPCHAVIVPALIFTGWVGSARAPRRVSPTTLVIASSV